MNHTFCFLNCTFWPINCTYWLLIFAFFVLQSVTWINQNSPGQHLVTVLLSIPFNHLHCYSRSQQWMEQQIGSSTASASTNHNGLYVESFSSSTDPSFYRASTSHEDTNLDDDDWLVRICPPMYLIFLKVNISYPCWAFKLH